jgi:CubicO group peptidase (beta-lactamase class C family)
VRALTLLAALLALGAGAATSLGATGPADSALDRGLDALVATRGGPPGAIAIVQRGDEVTVHAAGVARVGSPAPPRATQPMRIASVSKAYNGAAALALVARGALSRRPPLRQGGRRRPTGCSTSSPTGRSSSPPARATSTRTPTTSPPP